MRLLIIEPSVLKSESLKKLQDVGWGLCRVPRLEYMKVSSRKVAALVVRQSFVCRFICSFVCLGFGQFVNKRWVFI